VGNHLTREATGLSVQIRNRNRNKQGDIMKIVEANIQKLINNHCSKGRMGSVTFRKADDSIRKMTFIKVCPEKHCKGTGTKRKQDPTTVTVYDIKAKGIRSFKTARVLSLSVAGRKYTR
jgi:hypothetical protein